jgi:hypothetical protein
MDVKRDEKCLVIIVDSGKQKRKNLYQTIEVSVFFFTQILGSLVPSKIKEINMKLLLLALLVIASVSCGSTEQPSAKSEPFTGLISASQLITEYPQFRSVYEQYQPSSAEMAAVKSISGKSLIVLFGTWCHDSEREVPRLLKLLDLSGVKLQSLSLYGVNYNKQEPSNLHQQYNLQHSPTIILLQGESELGRVVEKPIVSLGEDLAGFISE